MARETGGLPGVSVSSRRWWIATAITERPPHTHLYWD